MSRCRRRFSLFLIPCSFFLAAGCQQQMGEQPSYRPLEPSAFFADGQSARPPVPGTVARGQLRTDTRRYKGLTLREPAQSAALVGVAANPLAAAGLVATTPPHTDRFPSLVTRDVMERGRERYRIYCMMCHDPLGHGEGKIVERGYTKPPSYHEARLRNAPVGYFFDVITNGYGSMPDYAAQVPPDDRWAIIAYIRALQLSQNTPLDQLRPEAKQALEEQREP